MAWNDDLRDAAYEAPDGTRIEFDYEDVSRAVEKHTGAFNFPNANGTYIQDLGHSGYKYPLRLFFWGDDYNEQADQLEELLLQRGAGTLEHPIYGRKLVVPFGAITRRDDLKTAANQAIIELVFWETIPEIYPIAQVDPLSGAQSFLGKLFSGVANQFADLIGLDSASERASFKAKFQSLQSGVKNGLQSVADAQEDVQQVFNTIDRSINSSIDLLIGEPLTLAFQTVALIRAPARAFGLIQQKLDGYKNLADIIISSGDDGIEPPTLDSEGSNNFHTSDLYASGIMGGTLESTLNVQFETKTAALEAADFALTQFDELVNWRDANFAALSDQNEPDLSKGAQKPNAASVDTGTSYQALQEAVAGIVGYLVEISFSLKQEKALVVTHPRNMVELAFELYGNVDNETIDLFINSNALTGSEMLEIPVGRRIVYYV